MVLQGVFQTPWNSVEKIEDSTPFLRVLLFLEEALKLPEKFLILLPTFYEKGLQRCRRTCLSLTIFLGVMRSCFRSFRSSHARLAVFSLGSLYLVLPTFSGFFQNSWKDCYAFAKYLPGSIHLYFCFPCITKDKVLMGCFPSIRQDLF